MRRTTATLWALAVVGAAAAVPASAAKPASGRPALAQPPHVLPGDAAGSAGKARTWIVAARPGADIETLAQRFGARRISARGAFELSRERARAFAAALAARGDLAYSEPNRAARRHTGRDPLSDTAGWRDYIVHTSVAEPAIGPASPRLALIDTPVDLTHPELSAGANVTTTAPGVAPFDVHGTATASVASAPVNGVGFVGVWPGMRTLNVAMPQELRCADSARGIAGAIEIGVATINMSYGSPNLCFAEYVEIQHAVSRGVIPVAAAGNEFNEGNPLEFPASLPHVLTVAAVGPDLRPSFFSNASAAVDLSAPGSGILAAVPSAFDEDGQKDGYTFLSGTSFSAPMVAAAATWVRAARPTLESDQVAQVVRLSAQDLGAEGWDSATGFGLLSIGGALRRAPPAADPLEPNDDIVWVNGTAFGRPDPPIHRGGTSRRTIRALLDQYEDPADVYRVTLRPRSRARAEVRPSFGDADLAVFDRRATRTSSRRYLLGRSQRNGTRTDRVTLTNRGRRTRSFFVEVYINQAVRGLDAGYRLTLRRLRLR